MHTKKWWPKWKLVLASNYKRNSECVQLIDRQIHSYTRSPRSDKQTRTTSTKRADSIFQSSGLLIPSNAAETYTTILLHSFVLDVKFLKRFTEQRTGKYKLRRKWFAYDSGILILCFAPISCTMVHFWEIVPFAVKRRQMKVEIIFIPKKSGIHFQIQ